VPFAPTAGVTVDDGVQRSLAAAVRHITSELGSDAADPRLLADALVRNLDARPTPTVAEVGAARVVTGEFRTGGAFAVAVLPPVPSSDDIDALVAFRYEQTPPDAATAAAAPPGASATRGVAWLYQGAWWGQLETELYQAFASPELDRRDATRFARLALSTLERYVGHSPLVPEDLDALVEALPPYAPEDDGYLPIATLVAAGLAAGELARHAHPRLQWVPGEDALARYFALRIGSDDDRLFRPIDFARQRYRDRIEDGFAAYHELVGVMLHR
jgi:hypothetical protein